MLSSLLKDRLEIVGLMPERALLRLRRAQIGVYNVKKIEKTKIVFCVKKKDTEKVFAIYPNVCYNKNENTPYAVKKLGAAGFGRVIENAKKRVGFLLGALLFAAVTAYMDGYIFSVEFVGSEVYAREAYAALEEGGIKPFARYKNEEIDRICSKLLSLEGVEFCSVQKSGLKARVEIRLSKVQKNYFQSGEMLASHTGEIVAITVLRGTPLKKIGDKIQAGEPLVGDWYSIEDKGQVRVESIARVRIACVYEAEIAAENEEEAFAKAYLEIGLSEKDVLKEKSFAPVKNGFKVRLVYEAIEQMNM